MGAVNAVGAVGWVRWAVETLATATPQGSQSRLSIHEVGSWLLCGTSLFYSEREAVVCFEFSLILTGLISSDGKAVAVLVMGVGRVAKVGCGSLHNETVWYKVK